MKQQSISVVGSKTRVMVASADDTLNRGGRSSRREGGHSNLLYSGGSDGCSYLSVGEGTDNHIKEEGGCGIASWERTERLTKIQLLPYS